MAHSEPHHHWEGVWSDKAPDQVSWYQSEPGRSLEWIQTICPDREGAIVDVGGGASTLVDHLLKQGYTNLTVLDIAKSALERAKKRLGQTAGQVTWRVGDVTQAELGGSYDLWHDRAVFHFLVDPDDRAAYKIALLRSLAPRGHVILATFALDGPEKCSGLPVERYDAEGLLRELGDGFEKVQEAREEHKTPWGDVQPFQFVHLKRTG